MFEATRSTPGDVLRTRLAEKGWTQDELAGIIGKPRQAINEIISGRRGITPEMALVLAAAFGDAASYWLRLDAERRLTGVEADTDSVKRQARLYEIAPIKDMQKRGWIRSTRVTTEIETELRQFFGVATLDNLPEFPVAVRKTTRLEELNPPQRAWCFRARQLASALQVATFNKSSLPKIRKKLRQCAAYTKEATHLPKLLGESGIRFVVIEPLPGAQIDGAAFWLDDSSPVLAVSLRYDRIDAFWFTVMHEFSHIEHGDGLSVDTDLAGENMGSTLLKDDIERRADEEAAASLVPSNELDSFVRRIGPLYSKPRIVQFAHRIKMHPGIIVGQLQHLGEIGYSANREMLAKIRHVIIEVALTDGWGRTIEARLT